MSDFVPNSAIFHSRGWDLAASPSTTSEGIADRMAELLMKSAIVELGA